MLTAEGSPYNFSGSYDVSGLGGEISAHIFWGDGTSSAASVGNAPQASRLKIRFDYSLDTSNFFSSQERRNLLQVAADSITSKLSDNLSAMSGSTGNTWRATFQNPATGQSITRENLVINANEILVYAGARNLAGSSLGFASRGGVGATFTDPSFFERIKSRGQAGALRSPATDFGPWGGSIAFNQSTRWHFGATTDGLESNEFDFMSIAQHEILHILGFGTSESFDRWLVGGNFTGPNTQRVAGKTPVPMANPDHFSNILIIDGKSALMDSGTSIGTRELPTRLEYAALQDLGWTPVKQTVTVSGTHTYGDNGNLSGTVRLRGSRYGELTFPISIVTTNVAPTLTKPSDASVVIGSPLSLPNLGAFTDPGFGFGNAQPPTKETFTYSIDWGDGSPIDRGDATVTQVGNASRVTKGTFGGGHTYASTGTYRAVLTIRDDDGGTATQSFQVQVRGVPTLALTSDRSSFYENAGSNAASLTIVRSGFDLSRSLVVSLDSDQSDKVSLPQSATIPAGSDRVSVPIRALDNNLLDGDVTVRITASTGSTRSGELALTVQDYEALLATTTLASFSENAGAGVSSLTVRRPNSDISSPLTVQLRSSDESELQLPRSVVIPAGESRVVVGINAIDDNLFDGQQVARVSVDAAGYVGTSLSFAIDDYQPLQLAMSPIVVLHEEVVSQNGADIIVSVRSPAPVGGVMVALVSAPPRQLTHPEFVVIPAGATSATVRVQAIDDYVPQGDRQVRLSASGIGMQPALIDIALSDEDESIWTNMADVYDVDGDGSLSPLDVLRIVNLINATGSRMLDPVEDGDELFIDPDMDGWVTPLDALYVINEMNQRLRSSTSNTG